MNVDKILSEYNYLKDQIDIATNPTDLATRKLELEKLVRESLSAFNDYLQIMLGRTLSPFKQTNNKPTLLLKEEFIASYNAIFSLVDQKWEDRIINHDEYRQICSVLTIIKDYFLPNLKNTPHYNTAVVEEKKVKTYASTRAFEGMSKLIIAVAVAMLCIGVKNEVIKIPHTTSGVSYLNNISAPTQSDASGQTVIKAYNTEIAITYMAEYSITGRVVSTATFLANKANLRNKFSPKDVSIVWGPLSDKKVDRGTRWIRDISIQRRGIIFTSSNSQINAGGDPGQFISNNHLIPANNQIRSLMKAIKKNDYIRIDGYLVDVDYMQGSIPISLPTSLSRFDEGNGACEQIYVIKITWLKP